jgi:hypothetical protein
MLESLIILPIQEDKSGSTYGIDISTRYMREK